MARTVAQRKARQAARRKRVRLQILSVLLTLVLVGLVAAALMMGRQEQPGIELQNVTVQIGALVKPEQFLKNPGDFKDIRFLTDMSAVDMTKEGTYRLELWVDGQTVSAILVIQQESQSPDVGLRDLTVEAGTEIRPEQFLVQPGADVSFVTDISAIDMTVEGQYPITLRVNGKDQTVTLRIEDTVAPVGMPVEGLVVRGGILPEPTMLVTEISDAGRVTVRYLAEPDVSAGGQVAATVVLTDSAGNSTEIGVSFTVDASAPVIDGAIDRKFFVDESVSYKSGVTVTDDLDPSPRLRVDNSQVDPATPGTYPVVYSATDGAGNVTTVTVYFTFETKPDGYVEPEVVYDLARKVLDQITTEDMTDMQVAFAIYDWVKSNIGYTGHSDKSSWTQGAYQAFTDYAGDCFNYYAAAKALYEVAGIHNIDVVKVVTDQTSRSSHYWSLINLGDGWYHVDCTPRNTPGFFFMNTDEELLAYSAENRNSHNFDSSAYPDRAVESVQHLVDYENKKVDG